MLYVLKNPSALLETHRVPWYELVVNSRLIFLVMDMQDPSNLLTGNANGYVGGQIYFDAFNVGSS